MNVITIKNVKSITGREGLGFTCSVYIDGRPVCKVEDWGDGGSTEFSRNIAPADLEILKEAGRKHVLGHPEKFDFMIKDGKLTSEVEIEAWAIHPLVDEHFYLKKIRGWCRTKTVLQMPGAPEGQFATIAIKYANTAAQDAAILAKNPGAVIVNKRFL